MTTVLTKASLISYVFMRRFLDHLPSSDESGATAVEYALIVGLIAAVIFGSVLALGQVVLALFTTVAGAL